MAVPEVGTAFFSHGKVENNQSKEKRASPEDLPVVRVPRFELGAS